MLELSQREEVILVILVFSHKKLKILIKLLVDSFYLYFSLQIPHSREDNFDAK